MAKGSSSRSGPAPDPNALRRDRDAGDWITLPAEGRKGAPPKWPLADFADVDLDDEAAAAWAKHQRRREAELWKQEWKRPQAVQWELDGQVLEVAIYVRSVVAAEHPLASAASRNLVIRQMEQLGISQVGLRANRWRIGDATKPGARSTAKSAGARGGRRPAARDRLRIVTEAEGA